MDDMVNAIVGELELRKDYLSNKKTETIYFGGGTPSLLTEHQLARIFDATCQIYDVQPGAEITLEANPDDLTPQKLRELKRSPVNRLSIGVQSFFDEDLRLMNRAHNAVMAEQCILDAASAGFDNLTIDLIYGVPGMSNERWRRNLEKAFSLPVQHLSCYNLTVETKTALYKKVSEGVITEVSDEQSAQQFMMLMDFAAEKGFEHYEISNFARPGLYSRHNTAYWQNKPFIGIGPSAHSFKGEARQWNVSSNAAYISAINRGEVPATIENLTAENRYNEYIMTRLRTMWGVDVNEINSAYGESFLNDFILQIHPFIESGDVLPSGSIYTLSRSGKLIADRIASRLMVV
jgi:oxygen-independent coproporphyrinogen-3 oxidase